MSQRGDRGFVRSGGPPPKDRGPSSLAALHATSKARDEARRWPPGRPDSWKSKADAQAIAYDAGGPRGRLRPPARAPAARHLLGDRAAEAPARRGPAGQAVPRPGGRLRRDARRLPVAGHREQAEDPAPDVARDDPRGQAAGRARRALRGAVRQAAQQARRVARGRRAPELLRRHGQPPGVHRERLAAPTPRTSSSRTATRR